MNELARSTIKKSIKSEENKLFFKKWLKSPAQLGTFAPISQKLAETVASQLVITPNTTVVEIGAGTGRLTRALLARGVNVEKLTMIELDHQMCDFLGDTLRQFYPNDADIKVVNGDACHLPDLIPSAWIGNVDYVVSAIPLLNLNEDLREKIIQSAVDVLNPDTGSIIHVSYSPISPIRFMDSVILQKRAVSLWSNVPPGFVWRFTPKRYLHCLSA